jgi:hypothetical protein
MVLGVLIAGVPLVILLFIILSGILVRIRLKAAVSKDRL